MKWKKTFKTESYLPVAPGWYQGTGVEHVSVLQSKSQLRGKTERQKTWCLSSLDGQIWTIPLLGKEDHLYILSRHPSQSDQYIIITPSLLLNGFDTMDQAS